MSTSQKSSSTRDRWRARNRKASEGEKTKEDALNATLDALIIEDDPNKAKRRTVHLTVEGTESKSGVNKLRRRNS